MGEVRGIGSISKSVDWNALDSKGQMYKFQENLLALQYKIKVQLKEIDDWKIAVITKRTNDIEKRTIRAYRRYKFHKDTVCLFPNHSKDLTNLVRNIFEEPRKWEMAFPTKQYGIQIGLKRHWKPL